MASEVTAKARGLMMGRIRPVMIAVGLVAAIPVITSRLVDEGEVVTLMTVDDQGRDYMTEVWIVDLPSGSYLRAGSSDARWLARISSHPEVTVVRDEHPARFRAAARDEEETRRIVNAAMAEKYGFADELWSRMSDRDRAVPIHLEPIAATATVP